MFSSNCGCLVGKRFQIFHSAISVKMKQSSVMIRLLQNETVFPRPPGSGGRDESGPPRQPGASLWSQTWMPRGPAGEKQPPFPCSRVIPSVNNLLFRAHSRGRIRRFCVVCLHGSPRSGYRWSTRRDLLCGTGMITSESRPFPCYWS